MAENYIKYSDLIKPDQSFDKLIGKLEELKNQYKLTASEISSSAKQLANDLKAVNSATSAGRALIDQFAASSSRYLQVMEGLKDAAERVSRSIEEVNKNSSDSGKVSQAQARALGSLQGKYAEMEKTLRQLTTSFSKLSAAQKADPAFGGALVNKIDDTLKKIGLLERQLNNYSKAMAMAGSTTEMYLKGLTAEERALASAKERLSIYNAELRRGAKAVTESERATLNQAVAQDKLRNAQSLANEQLMKINLSTREANLLAKYKAQLDGHVVDVNNLAASSYNQLSAQYGINKLAINKLTDEERKNTEAGRALESQTYDIYQQMKKLQEQTGKNTLSVGDYNKVWDGLRYQTQQVVRELPSLTVSLNQFFLAISNNIPLLADEIKRFKEEGNSSKDAIKRIVSSMFSWQTALIVGLTLLAKYGKQIGEFVKSLANGGKASYSFAESLREVNKEVSNTKVGDEVAKFQALRKEWGNLSTAMEKTKFLQENKSEIESLGAAVNNLAQAENLFSKNADSFIQAMMVRAKATAAATVAGQAYQDWVEKTLAAENIRYNQQRGITKIGDFFRGFFDFSEEARQVGFGDLATYGQQKRLSRKESQAEAAFTKGTRITENLQSKMDAEYKRILKEAGITTTTSTTTTAGTTRDLQSYIDNMVLRLKKAHDDILEAIGPDSYSQQLQKVNDDYEEKMKQLQNIIDKNTRELGNSSRKYTEEQRKQLIDANAKAAQALSDLQTKYEYDLNKLKTQHRINRLEVQNAASELRAADEDERSEVVYQEKLATLKRNMEIEILQNSLLTEEEMQSEYEIRRKWNRKIEELQIEHANIVRNARLGVKENIAAGAPSDLSKGLEANLYAADVSYSQELDAFEMGPKEEQTQEAWDAIIAKHTANRKKIYADYFTDVLSQQQAADKAEFDAVKHSEYEVTKFTLEQEKERLQLMKQLYDEGILDLNADQLRELLANIARVSREQKEAISDLLQDTVGGTLLAAMGFDEESISQFEAYKDEIISQLGELLQAEIEMAEKEIELQQKRVDAAQDAYDAEVRARANGYANNVASAKRELQLQKSTLAKKQAQAEKYQKAQRALDTAQQASSLVTATANLWSTLSSIPVVGPILAAVATAGMFAAFIASKVKASQLTSTYGEGGLEILEGGSHASGHDIDLGVSNSRGRRMRAEGGEAMAIINKKRTRKYRSILPDLIDSLNAGTFEEKYMRPSEMVSAPVIVGGHSDLGNLERGVDKLVRQNNTRVIQLSDRVVIIEGNTKRTVKL